MPTPLLLASAFSATVPLVHRNNPWKHPWLYTAMKRLGWIDYDTPRSAGSRSIRKD